MSEHDETYCRLCAEPTPTEQLITAEDDVAKSSKILTKMLWINVDTSTSTSLPSSICFSCFDALERTWIFLNNVRLAQHKLSSIFTDKDLAEKQSSDSENKPDIGKPVDQDWEDFNSKKAVIKLEETATVYSVDQNAILRGDSSVFPVEQNVILQGDYIKNEPDDLDLQDEGFNTSDSDEPLHLSVKKKDVKKVKVMTNIEAVAIDPVSLCISWNNYNYCCSKCDAQCKDVESLRLHSIQIHNCCCKFKCSDCSKVFSNFKMFVNHVRMHKKILRYCCEFCNVQFNMKSSLRRHKKDIHSNIMFTMCESCGMNFESLDLLQNHFNLYSKTKRRRRGIIGEELKCKLCDKEFKSRSNLLQHNLVHTERSRDFSCHVCGKMFFTKGTLSTHMATHEDTKPFKCEYCSMAFRARGNLQSHISLHSGAKPFVCEQCGKSFRAKRHLKSHSIVHTDLMPYVCAYCNKTFRFKTRLNLHLRQHTGAKPYNCVYCQRNFTNGSNYKKHMKRRHNIDTSVRNKYNVQNPNGTANDEIEDQKDASLLLNND